MMLALAILAAYVLGSLPSGLWLGLRIRGIDIREHGSRNIGATNAMRVLGKGLGAVALAADIGKGLVSVLFVARLSAWEYAPLACGLAAILGHTFSVFLRFRGGKGVATSAGVFFALTPMPMFIALATFLFVVAMTRMVSAGSIVAAIALGVAVNTSPQDLTLRVLTTAVAVAVVFLHRANIKRIFSGTESRL